MSMYLNINQQTMGPYENSAVLAWLQSGRISLDVMACSEGAHHWLPLRDLLSVLGINAIHQSSDPATAQARTCEKCGQLEGDVYSFYYGTKGPTRMVSLTSNKYVTSYQIAGRKDVAVCDACLQRRSISKVVFFGFMIAVGVLAALVGLIKAQAMPPFLLCMGLPAFIFILLGIIGLKETLSPKTAYDAETIAIALKRGELQRQGFNTFMEAWRYHIRSQRQAKRYR